MRSTKRRDLNVAFAFIGLLMRCASVRASVRQISYRHCLYSKHGFTPFPTEEKVYHSLHFELECSKLG